MAKKIVLRWDGHEVNISNRICLLKENVLNTDARRQPYCWIEIEFTGPADNDQSPWAAI